MVGGFNTNVSYLGRTFHVQTEDGGRESPQIITLLYEGGAILFSKKSSYATPGEDTTQGGSALEETVRRLMEEQHRVMVEALKEGKLDRKIGAADAGDSTETQLPEGGFGAGVLTGKPLDELILEHIAGN